MTAHAEPYERPSKLLRRRKSGDLAGRAPPATSASSSSSSSATASSSSAAASAASSSPSGATLPRSPNIIPLNYGFSDGQLVYSAPLTLGSNTTLNVLVDTGSADLWVADTRCRSDSCQGTSNGNEVQRYDVRASGAVSTGKSWNISYVNGGAEGDVWTQDVQLGKAQVKGQAFGAATDVDNEQLASMNVSGILGLSLTSNSVIGAGENNSLPTPSITGDVLAGLWADADTGTRMFGVGLQRLPSDGGGRTATSSLSLLGVDPAYVSSSSRIPLTQVVPDANGLAHHWKLYLTDISANNGSATFRIPTSFPGQTTLYPTVVLDTAAPLNYAPAALLNAIYGTYVDPSTGQRLGPSDSGIYYTPCTLPLNLTLSVGGISVPIHPLDASLAQDTPDTSGAATSGCIGSFQSLDAGSPAGADVVLGAPFLRSAYSVYTCDGVLQGAPAAAAGDSGCLNPQVGLFPTTTNLTEAFDEFHQVRVEGKSLGSNAQYGINTSNDSGGLSTGGKIAIGVVVAFLGMMLLFGLLAWYARRRARRSGADGGYTREKEGGDAGATDETHSDSASHKAAVAALSAKEQARLREAALLHGYFADDIVPEGSEQQQEPRWGTDSTTQSFAAGAGTNTAEWDTSSRGYVDARRVRRQYLARHPSLIELQERKRGEEVGEQTMAEEADRTSTSSQQRLVRTPSGRI
ncbi:acid protease [Jaminaea rosea]|uniref:Acid protease n=1 Tax=Jaminaea rosea TaxID=1569628 RepID=A0A316UTP2_9BASI|nr:acid protease [Jaminaea rosea]PWN28657.1 acid protease [Jaminaea rosea]